MKRFSLMSVAAFAAVLGCVVGLGVASLSPAAEAQDATAPAAKQFTECFGGKLWAVNGSHLNNGRGPEKTVRVPKGWTVAGGSGSMMILCR